MKNTRIWNIWIWNKIKYVQIGEDVEDEEEITITS